MWESVLRTEHDVDPFDREIWRASHCLPGIHPQAPVKLSDEELCRNAQQGCTASKDILWKKYINFIRVIVWQENKHCHLPPNEVNDALQELYFAFHLAVQRYNPKKHEGVKPASFKTFLRIVIAHAFATYCNKWRRYHKHIVTNFDQEVPPRSTVEIENPDHFPFFGTDKNGQSSLDWQVMLWVGPSADRLASILKQLNPREKHLLEVWLECGRDKDVAQILGISPVAAKLRRERIFYRIRQSVAKN